MKKHPRLKKANIIFLLLFVLMIVFGYIDSIQINAYHESNDTNKDELYHDYTAPSFIALWYVCIFIIALLWLLFTTDWSETLGIIFAGWTMLLFIVPDPFFFMLSKFKMTNEMCWFNEFQTPLTWISEQLFRESCISPKSLIISSIIGVIIAYIVFWGMFWINPKKTKIKRKNKRKYK